MATVRIEPSGYVTAFTAQAPHGQSHETTLAQVVASELGVPFENVKVVHGDTQTAPFSMIGTGGSRAATMASGAALFATREVERQGARGPAAGKRWLPVRPRGARSQRAFRHLTFDGLLGPGGSGDPAQRD